VKRSLLHAAAFLAAAFFCACASAAPTLTAAPYPPGDAQPTSATLAVTPMLPTGPSPIATQIKCTLPAAVNGDVTPTCDLSPIANPGAYSLVLTVSTLQGCSGGPAAFYCDSGGTASSDPFTLTFRSGSAKKPTPSRIAP